VRRVSTRPLAANVMSLPHRQPTWPTISRPAGCREHMAATAASPSRRLPRAPCALRMLPNHACRAWLS
jgi:hypothetical protein